MGHGFTPTHYSLADEHSSGFRIIWPYHSHIRQVFDTALNGDRKLFSIGQGKYQTLVGADLAVVVSSLVMGRIWSHP